MTANNAPEIYDDEVQSEYAFEYCAEYSEQAQDTLNADTSTEGESSFGYKVLNLGLTEPTSTMNGPRGIITIYNEENTTFRDRKNNIISIIFKDKHVQSVIVNWDRVYNTYASLPIEVGNVLATARVAINEAYEDLYED